MSKHTVEKVIDGDTFTVYRRWKWGDSEGKYVRINGYDTPEKDSDDYQKTTQKLKKLIEGKQIEIVRRVDIHRGRLVADVELDGKNLAEYFPQYQKS